MEINPKILIYHELIGLKVRVMASTNQSMVGLKGSVVDETRNMLVIETPFGVEKKLPKSCTELIFTLPGGERVKVKGSILVSRPEDRIRKKFR